METARRGEAGRARDFDAEQGTRSRVETLPTVTVAIWAAIGQVIHGAMDAKAAERVRDVFHGSNALVTRRLYRDLERTNNAGPLAADLLRAQKASTRAKSYRGDYRRYGYEVKGLALNDLATLLDKQEVVRWGWGDDPGVPTAPYVLYLDLPNGQVSFHATWRHQGPTYSGGWDGAHSSEFRILEFAAAVLMIGTASQTDEVVSSVGHQCPRTSDQILADKPELVELQRRYQRKLYEATWLGGDRPRPRDLRRAGDEELARAVERYPNLFSALQPDRFPFRTIGCAALTRRDLYERGWSKVLIKRTLSPPDFRGPSEDGSGNVVSFYEPARVLAVEERLRGQDPTAHRVTVRSA